ncbi:helix-turn-helix transcriptional regulator [Gilvimarinus sp. F26214L]|uniref:helix-turn-helix transcriptional regulator n=1 Tax=Gilvimarinus sp. DZF01 TaxID=3461371 RepID=UPI0040451E94
MATSLAAVHKLYIGRKRSLFLGAGHVPLREYTVGADQLLVCLSGEIVWHRSSGSREVFRSALLRAGTRVKVHELDNESTVAAVCFLDPIGQDFAALERAMGECKEGVWLHHRDEAHLAWTLRQIRDQRLPPAEAFDLMETLVFPPWLDRAALPHCDPRIVRVVQRIRESARSNLPVSQLAEEVHLSESRLVKLFKSEIGIPITRYRLRYRVMVGAVYLSLGRSVTEAALAAGFASTAHFSKCFVAMIGTQPSTAFLGSPYLDISLSEDVLGAVAAARGEPGTASEPDPALDPSTP